MKGRSSRKHQERTPGDGIVQGSIFDPRQQRLDHAGIARVFQRLALWRAYCASSANIRARNATGFFLFIAMHAMPAIGSQRSAASLSTTSRVTLDSSHLSADPGLTFG
jgi:hypothetical protein